ncbi:phosphotransferase [Allorhizocola rhizosphaerae]|uniref:phosphotransferase n=1 Tax=Allorhizocola rhizosphaerae TaxID=1872709 RepID=UPI000E3E40A7|nr:phosphotransferase [Allorhizocola rhizosphaerae]
MSVDLPHALVAAAQRLGVAQLRVFGQPLAGSPRAVVVRAGSTAGDEHRHVVVKAFDIEQTDEGWPRESTALSVLNGRRLPAPTLLAAVADPPLIVTADLGTGLSLADRLRGDDAGAAALTLQSWARSLGRLHAATVEAGRAFAAGLTPGIAADSTEAMVTDGIESLSRNVARVGLTASDEAIAPLRALAGSVGGPVALSPADACPDNNVETPDGLVLVDFENATVRPVAWDLAYLVVPWPTCWCAWRLPDGLAADALAEWRSASALPLSTLDIARAAIVWVAIATGWLLGGALDGVSGIGRDDRTGPPRRALLLHRLGLLTGATETRLAPVADLVDPALRTLATQLRTALVHQWGEQELPLPPALD